MSSNSLGQQQHDSRLVTVARAMQQGRDMGGAHGLSPLGSSYHEADIEMRSQEDEDGNSTVDVGVLYGMKAETSPPQWSEHARDWPAQTTPTYGQGQWLDSPGSSIASSPKQGGGMGKMSGGKGKGKKMRADDDGHSGCDDEVDFEQAMQMDVQRIPVKTLRKVIPKLRIQCYMMSEASHGKKKFKHLWDERPQNWPMDIPFKDPNNAAKEVKKPGKEELRPMFEFLRDLYKEQNNQQQPSDETEGTTDVTRNRYSMLPSGADQPLLFAAATVPIASQPQSLYSRDSTAAERQYYLQQLIQQKQLQQKQAQQIQRLQQQQIKDDRMEYQGTTSGTSPTDEQERYRVQIVKQEPRQAYPRQDQYYTQVEAGSPPGDYNGSSYDSNGLGGGGLNSGGLLVISGGGGDNWQGVIGREVKVTGHDLEGRGLRGHDLEGRGLRSHDLEERGLRGHDLEVVEAHDGSRGHDFEDRIVRGRDLEGRGVRVPQQPQESRIPVAVQELRDRLRKKEQQVVNLSSPNDTKVKVMKVIEDVNTNVIDRLFSESTTVPLSRLMFLDAGHQMEALLDVMSVLNRFDQDLFENGCGEILRKFSSSTSLTVAPVTQMETSMEIIHRKLSLFSNLFSLADLESLSKILGEPLGVKFSDPLGDLKARSASLFADISADIGLKPKCFRPLIDTAKEGLDNGRPMVETGCNKLLSMEKKIGNELEMLKAETGYKKLLSSAKQKEDELNDGMFKVETGYGKSLEVCEDKVENLRLGCLERGSEGSKNGLGVAVRGGSEVLEGATEVLEERNIGGKPFTTVGGESVALPPNEKENDEQFELDPSIQQMLEEFLVNDKNCQKVLNETHRFNNQLLEDHSLTSNQSQHCFSESSASNLPSVQSHSSSPSVEDNSSIDNSPPSSSFYVENSLQPFENVEKSVTGVSILPQVGISTLQEGISTKYPQMGISSEFPQADISSRFGRIPHHVPARKRMRTLTESAQEFLEIKQGTHSQEGYQAANGSELLLSTQLTSAYVDQSKMAIHSPAMNIGQSQMLTQSQPVCSPSQTMMYAQPNCFGQSNLSTVAAMSFGQSQMLMQTSTSGDSLVPNCRTDDAMDVDSGVTASDIMLNDILSVIEADNGTEEQTNTQKQNVDQETLIYSSQQLQQLQKLQRIQEQTFKEHLDIRRNSLPDMQQCSMQQLTQLQQSSPQLSQLQCGQLLQSGQQRSRQQLQSGQQQQLNEQSRQQIHAQQDTGSVDDYCTSFVSDVITNYRPPIDFLQKQQEFQQQMLQSERQRLLPQDQLWQQEMRQQFEQGQQLQMQPQQMIPQHRQAASPVENIPTTVLELTDSDDAGTRTGQRGGRRPSGTGGKTGRRTSGKDGFKK